MEVTLLKGKTRETVRRHVTSLIPYLQASDIHNNDNPLLEIVLIHLTYRLLVTPSEQNNH